MPQRLSSLPSLLQGLLVLVALFAAPLLFEPWTYEQYLLPKYTAAAGLGILLALLLWTRACAGQLVRLPLHAVNRWLALFLLWNLVLWPLAQSPSLAADRVLWLAAVLVISWAWQEWAGQRPRRILLAAWCLAASAGATALWALWQDASIHWGWAGTAGLLNRLGDWRGVVVAGLGNSDYTAMFLAIAYLPLLLLMLFTRSRIQAAALLLTLWLTAAALIVTWSVGNNGALILGALVLATCIRKHFGHLWHKAGRRILIWTAGCLLIIAWLSTNNPLNPHQRADDGLPGIFGEAFASERWIAGGPTRGVIWFNS
ncbi:hypothetical protein HQ520_02995, partial [bacterium]|nr:hypothetical protein [bacterium]